MQSQMGTEINLTKGETRCKVISSMLTWFERAESVFFIFFKLNVALIYAFQCALHHIRSAFLRAVIIYLPGVQTPASLGLPYHL